VRVKRLPGFNPVLRGALKAGQHHCRPADSECRWWEGGFQLVARKVEKQVNKVTELGNNVFHRRRKKTGVCG